jgi:hypothetical protein
MTKWEKRYGREFEVFDFIQHKTKPKMKIKRIIGYSILIAIYAVCVYCAYLLFLTDYMDTHLFDIVSLSVTVGATIFAMASIFLFARLMDWLLNDN